MSKKLTGATIAVAVLAPLAPLLIWSFTYNWFFPSLLPQRWSLRAWVYVLSPSSRVVEAVGTSALLAIVVVMVCLVVGLPAARVLGLRRFRAKGFVEWMVMLPLLAPTLVVTMGIHILFIRYGLADSFFGVALIHVIPALPYFVLVMSSVFANYSVALEETARTLGASPVRVFWYITLPAIWQGLVVASLFTSLVSWSQYITTVLIGGGTVLTLPMVLFPFISAANHPASAVVSILFVAPALLVLIFTTRVLGGRVQSMGGLGRF